MLRAGSVATRTSRSMDLRLFEAKSSLAGMGKDLPRLSGQAASVRQVLAAHFVRQCRHVIEIGGHIRPVTPYLTHLPESALVVGPKTDQFDADELDVLPCDVRHMASRYP